MRSLWFNTSKTDTLKKHIQREKSRFGSKRTLGIKWESRQKPTTTATRISSSINLVEDITSLKLNTIILAGVAQETLLIKEWTKVKEEVATAAKEVVLEVSEEAEEDSSKESSSYEITSIMMIQLIQILKLSRRRRLTNSIGSRLIMKICLIELHLLMNYRWIKPLLYVTIV